MDEKEQNAQASVLLANGQTLGLGCLYQPTFDNTQVHLATCEFMEAKYKQGL